MERNHVFRDLGREIKSIDELSAAIGGCAVLIHPSPIDGPHMLDVISRPVITSYRA